MSTRRGAGASQPPDSGSRFLYDGFDAAHARIEANERVAEERWSALEFRLAQIDQALDRLEKRIWLGVYGMLAFILARGAEVVMTALMK